MGNFNNKEPDETYQITDDKQLYDVINSRRRLPTSGDMIQFHRKDYEHWAVYIGNGNVIQVTVYDSGKGSMNTLGQVVQWLTTRGEATAKARVTQERLCHVITKPGGARINNFKDREWPVLSSDEILQRATDALGTELDYHVLTNNCEHFATRCRYGKRLCGQEEAFWETITLGAYKGK